MKQPVFSRYVRRRSGFVLLAVLWTLVGVGILVLTLIRIGRESIGAAQNRANGTQDAWLAEGCAERARAAISDALRVSSADSVWSTLDTAVASSPLVRGCHVSLAPSGLTLDVNAADPARLRTLLLASGRPAEKADSLIDAILDWADADDTPRPFGAERDWYRSRDRVLPRNGPFQSAGEFRDVAGIDTSFDLDTLLGVDDGPVLVTRAPIAVLATLPGFDGEVLATVSSLRSSHRLATTLQNIAAALRPAERDQLIANYPALVALATSTPVRWILTADAASGSPVAHPAIELTLVRVGARTAIVRRRGNAP